MSAAETEALQDLNADYTERYGFHDAEDYLYKAPKGLTASSSRRSRSSRTSPSGCSSSA
jgi:Fe-S cluster assembly protein SufB